MAKKLKSYYNTACARMLAEKINNHHQSFDKTSFVAHVQSNLRGKEFLERQDLFVEAFEQNLFSRYDRVLALFTKILGPELETSTGMFTHGWWLWPIGRYVEKHGLRDPQRSTDFIYELTKRFTGEFAIRPILEAHPKQTMNLMHTWSKDPNVHVRRLSSEGMRMRLPWAKKSTVCLDQFSLFTKTLTNLKDDPDKFVQKSVGNNLNDLMKEHPEQASEIIASWKKKGLSKPAAWIIKHGQRSLRKKKKP